MGGWLKDGDDDDNESYYWQVRLLVRTVRQGPRQGFYRLDLIYILSIPCLIKLLMPKAVCPMSPFDR